LYQIQTGGKQAYHLHQARITVCEDGADAPVVLLHQDKALPYRLFERHQLLPRSADDKTLNERVEQAKAKQTKPPRIPSPNHPWRNYQTNAAAGM
jgi:hypothetical protein